MKIHLDKKFWSDSVWNYGSFCILVAVGVILNFLILLRLGADSLGVFNQIYAIYVIAGQIAVFGLHDSAQKHVSQFADNPAIQRCISIAALAAVVLTGLFGAVLLLLASGAIGEISQSSNVGLGVLFLSPGLSFFTINKVLMGILNGRRRMISFAIGSSLRALAVLVICVAIVLRSGRSFEFGIAFTSAEIFLFVFLLAFLRPIEFEAIHSGIADISEWMWHHLAFGGKALVHGFLAETFLRIDIIMLGIFVSDREVGIYSFAAMFVEGIYQVPIVIRNITNPILVPMLLVKDKAPFVSFARKTGMISFLATLAVSAAVAILYPHFGLFFPRDVVNASYIVILILLTGLVAYSAYVPFDYVFLQAGRPGLQSIFMSMNTAVNVIFNFILISLFGLYGACIATAIAFIFSGLNLNILASQTLGFHKGIFGIGRAAKEELCLSD